MHTDAAPGSSVEDVHALTPALLVTLHRLMQVRQHALAASRSRRLLLQPPSSRHLPRLLRRDRRRRSCRLQRATKATATRLITGVSACTTLSRYLHTAVTYTPSVLRLLHTPHHMLSYTYAPQRHLHTAVTYTLLSPTMLHLHTTGPSRCVCIQTQHLAAAWRACMYSLPLYMV